MKAFLGATPSVQCREFASIRQGGGMGGTSGSGGEEQQFVEIADSGKGQPGNGQTM